MGLAAIPGLPELEAEHSSLAGAREETSLGQSGHLREEFGRGGGQQRKHEKGRADHGQPLQVRATCFTCFSSGIRTQGLGLA